MTLDARGARQRLDEIRAGPDGKATAEGIERRARQLAKELQADEQTKFERAVEDDKTHSTLMDICTSAFGPRSMMAGREGFVFITAEPLIELSVPNFDILIVHPQRGDAILVECKGSVSDAAPVVGRVIEKIEAFRANKTYLETRVGVSFNYVEFVICVPGASANRIVRDLERREHEGTLDPRKTKILVWQVDIFNSTINLVTNIRDRPQPLCQHALPGLTRALAEGVSVSDEEVTSSCYPGTHPFRKTEAFIGWHVRESIRHGASPKEVTRAQLQSFFTSPRHVPHYDVAQFGTQDADALIRLGKESGLLVETAPNQFVMEVEGVRPETILANFTKSFAKEWVSRRVEQESLIRALEEAGPQKQKRLTEF